ncbi:MAG: flagellar motor stator protein MotA [Oscillospiraceae bacterium]|jgi:chemotaxis protein MotA|nr:flagellar motor stator protein MotA [Oscillospiraceae bacterium]
MKKKIDLLAIIGLAFGVGAVLGAMYFKGVPVSSFNNPAALLVIFAGTLATILISFTGKELGKIGGIFGSVFNDTEYQSNKELIQMFLELTQKARKEGLLSLEPEVEKIDDIFLKKGLRMVVDGLDSELIEGTLELDIESMEERHGTNASVFSSAGAYAPTLGVLGAVFGLIAAMGSINDTENMSHAIAAAFMATILGIFTGYVMWNPFAGKLKVKTKHEAHYKHMLIEGILCLQKGEPAAVVKNRLLAMIPRAEQEIFEKEDGK